MRSPVFMFAALLAAAAAQAQSVPRASDSWTAPATASTSYRSGSMDPSVQREPQSHFKFKERRSPPLPGNAAQEHSGRAAIGGMGTMDRDGRPAVSCPQTPMDPACH